MKLQDLYVIISPGFFDFCKEIVIINNVLLIVQIFISISYSVPVGANSFIISTRSIFKFNTLGFYRILIKEIIIFVLPVSLHLYYN